MKNNLKTRHGIIIDVLDERQNQIKQWGEQNFPCVNQVLLPDGTFSEELTCSSYGLPSQEVAKSAYDTAIEMGGLSFAHIALEELCEVISEPCPIKRREELVQLTAVCVQWLEALDKSLLPNPAPRIYIAGKISGMEEEAAVIFSHFEKEISQLGFEAINPMQLPHQHDKTWASYMRECIAALTTCESIYMINNYTDSLGARVELFIAKSLGMEVYTKVSDLPKIK